MGDLRGLIAFRTRTHAICYLYGRNPSHLCPPSPIYTHLAKKGHKLRLPPVNMTTEQQNYPVNNSKLLNYRANPTNCSAPPLTIFTHSAHFTPSMIGPRLDGCLKELTMHQQEDHMQGKEVCRGFMKNEFRQVEGLAYFVIKLFNNLIRQNDRPLLIGAQYFLAFFFLDEIYSQV